MTCPSVFSKPTSLTCNANNADRAPASNVLEIKRQLNQLCGTPLRSDGSWGAEEISRLTRFQTAEGLPATGQADAETLERLARRARDAAELEPETAVPLQVAAGPTQTHTAPGALLHDMDHASAHGALHGVEKASKELAKHAAELELPSAASLKKIGTVAHVAGHALTLLDGGLRVLRAEDKTKETLKVVSGTAAEMAVGGPAATAATVACAPVIAFAAPVCGAIAYSVVGGGARFVAEGVVGGLYDLAQGDKTSETPLHYSKGAVEWKPTLREMLHASQVGTGS